MSGCTHLECTKTGERYESETLQTLSKAGAPLYARYDLSPVRRDGITADASLWRYRDVLPVRDASAVTTLGEGWTPIIEAPRLAKAFGVDAEILVKDAGLEGVSLTGCSGCQERA